MNHIRKLMAYIAFFFLLSILSSCNLENITKVVNVSPPKQKACVIGIWPTIQANSGYPAAETDAYRFVINVQAELKGYRGQYKDIKAERTDKPKACNRFLNYTGEVSPRNYANKCMVPWGEKSSRRYRSSCPAKDTYLIGAMIKKGKATPYIVRLDNPREFANKVERTAKGADLNRLARNLGILIKKELR